MGDDESEKRFQAIMDKLYRPPPTKSNFNTNRTSEVQFSRGKKRPNASHGLALVEAKSNGNSGEELHNSLSGSVKPAAAPLCRPWDRDDLFMRLATFKSMTWFAKPQVVAPVNCARRGWINVDMDTIACESCGARLLFSTPSAWTQQQVEKAALVFSLKLESGHKLLCPWINNACTDELAQFPPATKATLVEDYRKRFASLFGLSALPVISPLAIDGMKSPQLEQFLREPSAAENLPGGISMIKRLKDVPDLFSSISYYQAQRLISLCGWEPRTLPYVVDYKEKHNIIGDTNVVANSQKQIDVYSWASDEVQSDPNSIVLDCKLCGASVGLWAFALVSRPLESLRILGFTEVSGRNNSANSEVNESASSSGSESGKGVIDTALTMQSSLSCTIAGGPPPAKLNYKAMISLPVIGESLRARLLAESGHKDQSPVRSLMHDAGEATSELGFDANSSLAECETVIDDRISNDKLLENETVMVGSELGDHQEFVGGSSFLIQDNDPRNTNGELRQPNGEILVESCSFEPERFLHHQNDSGAQPIMQQIKDKPETSNKSENLNLPSSDKAMEFDPIKQHRHFCPWIVSSGKAAPGWKQTLCALQGHKELSFSSPEEAPLCSLIQVDDPVASVRKLFFPSPTLRKRRLNVDPKA